MVNFSFYRGTYGGSSISQESWTYYEQKALTKLKQYTRDYVVTVPEYSPDGATLARIPSDATDTYVKRVLKYYEKYVELYAAQD